MQKAGNNTIYNIPSTFLIDPDIKKLKWMSSDFHKELDCEDPIVKSLDIASKHAMETKAIEYMVFHTNLG